MYVHVYAQYNIIQHYLLYVGNFPIPTNVKQQIEPKKHKTV